MNDRILFRSDSLTEAASELNKLIDTLEDIAGDLNSIDTSAEWWSKISVSTTHGKNSAMVMVSMLKSDFCKTREFVSNVSSGVRKAQELFNKTDSEISKSAGSMFTGNGYDLSAKDADDIKTEKGSDEKKSWWDYLDLASFINKIIGKYGIAGGIINMYLKPIAKWADAVYHGEAYSFELTDKGIVDFVKDTVSIIANVYEVIDDKDADIFKKLFEASTETSGFWEDVEDLYKGDAASAFAWAGLGLSTISTSLDKLEEVNNGEISAGRAVAEVTVETIVDYAVTAGLSTFIPGIGVVVVKEGLDVTCKWFTSEYYGEEKGFAEGISDGLITIVTNPGQAIENVKYAFSAIFSGKAAAAAGG